MGGTPRRRRDREPTVWVGGRSHLKMLPNSPQEETKGCAWSVGPHRVRVGLVRVTNSRTEGLVRVTNPCTDSLVRVAGPRTIGQVRVTTPGTIGLEKITNPRTICLVRVSGPLLRAALTKLRKPRHRLTKEGGWAQPSVMTGPVIVTTKPRKEENPLWKIEMRSRRKART